MDSSERVTWETCPSCGRIAAVGWLDGHAIELDCTGGCYLSEEQVRAFADRRGRPPASWLTSA